MRLAAGRSGPLRTTRKRRDRNGDAGTACQARVEQDGVDIRHLIMDSLGESLADGVVASPTRVGVDAQLVGRGSPQIKKHEISAGTDGS